MPATSHPSDEGRNDVPAGTRGDWRKCGGPEVDVVGSLICVSNQAGKPGNVAGVLGTSGLPPDLTADELAAAPVLESADDLLIHDLTPEEDQSFANALLP